MRLENRRGISVALCALVLFATINAARAVEPEAGNRQISGVVVDRDGRPMAGVKVRTRLHGEIKETVTGSDGGFDFDSPPEADFLSLVASTDDGKQQGYFQQDLTVLDEGMAPPAVRLVLEPAIEFHVQVLDAAGKPADGAPVVAAVRFDTVDNRNADAEGKVVLRAPANAPKAWTLFTHQAGKGADYLVLSPSELAEMRKEKESVNVTLRLDGAQTVRVRAIGEDSRPIAGIPIYAPIIEKTGNKRANVSGRADLISVTDGDGVAVFDWIPVQLARPVEFFSSAREYHAPQRASFDPVTGARDVTLELVRKVEARGRLLLPNGRPAGGMKLRIAGSGANFDSCYANAFTDAEGRFSALVHPDEVYLFALEDEEWAATVSGKIAERGKPLDIGDVTLETAVRIRGVVTVGPKSRPQPGQQVALWVYPEQEGYVWEGPGGVKLSGHPQIIFWTTTDELGRFFFSTGRGRHALRGPDQGPTHQFEIIDEHVVELALHADRPEMVPITGLVLHKGKPVAGAKVTAISIGGSGRGFSTTTDGEGRFTAERSPNQIAISAGTEDEQLRGIVTVGGDQKDVSISIEPTAKVVGRLLDEETGEPVANRRLLYGAHIDSSVHFVRGFGGTAATDEAGRFEIAGLVVGVAYDFMRMEKGTGRLGNFVRLASPATADLIELGDVKLPSEKLAAEREARSEAERRVANAFGNAAPIAERLDLVLRDARLASLRALVVFARAKNELTTNFYGVYYSDDKLQGALADYRSLGIDVSSAEQAEAIAELAKRYDVALADDGSPMLLILDADGEKLATIRLADYVEEGKLDVERLVSLFREHAPPPIDAKKLLADAVETAKRDGKRIFLQESGTYCGPCYLLSRYYDDHRHTFDQHFVHVKIDAYRFTHGQEVMERIRGKDEGGGIPWIAIIEPGKRIVATSDAPTGNIGFPTQPHEIDHFINMLRAGAPMLDDAQLDELKKALAP